MVHCHFSLVEEHGLQRAWLTELKRGPVIASSGCGPDVCAAMVAVAFSLFSSRLFVTLRETSSDEAAKQSSKESCLQLALGIRFGDALQ